MLFVEIKRAPIGGEVKKCVGGLLWRGEESVSGTVECSAIGRKYVAGDAEKSGREPFRGPRKTKKAVM